MKKNILFSLLCLMPVAANAAIPYRVEQTKMPQTDIAGGIDSEALAREKRFYIGGAYNFSMYDGGTDENNVSISGKNNSSFEAMVGLRIYDTFRIEANYIQNNPEYDAFKLSSDTVMLNAIFDARIDNIYRLFRKQILVPYIGLGAGLSWNSATGAVIENKITPTVAAMAGIGLEFGARFAMDFGYRYIYMFSPEFDSVANFAPTANQFRAGVRVNF